MRISTAPWPKGGPALGMCKCRFSMDAAFIELADKGIRGKTESSTADTTSTVQTAVYFCTTTDQLQGNAIYHMLHERPNTYVHTTHKQNHLCVSVQHTILVSVKSQGCAEKKIRPCVHFCTKSRIKKKYFLHFPVAVFILLMLKK